MMRLLAIGPAGRAWSGAEARKDLREYASTSGTFDPTKYARGFMYAPPSVPPSGYKLPFANVYRTSAGHLVLRASPRAIESIHAVLDGARGGVDIPATDRQRAREQVERYYLKMGHSIPAWKNPEQLSLLGDEPNGARPGPRSERFRIHPRALLSVSARDGSPRPLRLVLDGDSNASTRATRYPGSDFTLSTSGAVVPYQPYAFPLVGEIAGHYEATEGRKVPKRTMYIAVQFDVRVPVDLSVASGSEGGGSRRTYDVESAAALAAALRASRRLTAHRTIAAAQKAMGRPSGGTVAKEKAFTERMKAAKAGTPNLDAESESYPTRKSDLSRPTGDAQPSVKWVWASGELGALLVSLGSASASDGFNERLQACVELMARRVLPAGAAYSVVTAGPEDVGGRGAMFAIQAKRKSHVDELAALEKDAVAEAFAAAWTSLYGESALDAYEEAHWGEQAESVELLDPRDLTPRGSLVALGELTEVVYRTTKGGGPLTDYHHTFGETGEERPKLAFDADFDLFVVGGGYTVTSRGIEG